MIGAMDNLGGRWIEGKARGYGLVVIQFKRLTFAIPLRSNIKHRAAHFTFSNPVKGQAKNKGLDFSKALLITRHDYVSTEPFKVPPQEYRRLRNKTVFITQSFEKYVNRYIKACKSRDAHILHSLEYRFTTLKNYHVELGIA